MVRKTIFDHSKDLFFYNIFGIGMVRRNIPEHNFRTDHYELFLYLPPTFCYVYFQVALSRDDIKRQIDFGDSG